MRDNVPYLFGRGKGAGKGPDGSPRHVGSGGRDGNANRLPGPDNSVMSARMSLAQATLDLLARQGVPVVEAGVVKVRRKKVVA